MRKLVAGIGALLMVGGLGGVALAGHAPGTNPTDPEHIGDHPARYGLCTAYFANGNGRANGRAGQAPPFAALVQAAEAEAAANHDDENTDPPTGDDAVRAYCDGIRPGNGHGNGGNSNAPNPTEHPRGNGGGAGTGNGGQGGAQAANVQGNNPNR